MSVDSLHLPPWPADPAEQRRWEHTRARRRLLSGEWENDLVRRLEAEVGTIRREAWGLAKLTSNPYATMCRELAALYLVAPEVRAPGGDVVYGALGETLAGLWPRMVRHQELTIGCREYLLRLSVSASGAVRYRPVPPDMVLAECSPDEPDVPTMVRELRWRHGYGWCWDVLDVRDPAAPEFRVERHGADGQPAVDLTVEVFGEGYSGEAYPYRDSRGEPWLPYVLHHATVYGACLFDWRLGVESYEATLDLAVLSTFLGHVMRDASWPQRYMHNARPVGLGVEGDAGGAVRQSIVTDPATVLLTEQPPEAAGTPLIGQWGAGADVATLEAVISAVANRTAIDAGLPPTDIQRLGGTARSGYAIALTNEGKRVAARRFAPAFRGPDELLVARTASLLNRATGGNLPEFGYSVVYRDLPLSPEELTARREDVLARLGAGLLSRARAYAELYGVSEEQARRDLAVIDAEASPVPALAEEGT